MTEYIIVPHGEREKAEITLKDDSKAEVHLDAKSAGYGDHNEDPFVRYEKAWFYSFPYQRILWSV